MKKLIASITSLLCGSLLFGLFFVKPIAKEEENNHEGERNWGGVRATPSDYRYSTTDIKNEPLYSTVNSLNYQHMNVGTSWNDFRGETSNGDPVTVAILDTGIDIYHEDFLLPEARNVTINESNVLDYSILDPKSCYIHDTSKGYYDSSVVTEVGILNAFDGDETTYDEDYDEYYSHGTASASCVAAAVNGVGGWGIAPKANLLIIKHDFFFTSLNKAIRYAADNGADVINMSLGAYAESFIDGDGNQQKGFAEADTELTSAINYALSKDCCVVAAAGNENTSYYSYPACNSGVIGVGALARKSGTNRASFSNFNKNTDTASGNHNVDVMAPGYVHTANVYQDGPHKTSGDLKDNYYYETRGTSFACPLTSGAIALARAAFPNETHTQIEERLFSSCFDLGTSGWDTTYGYGRVDITRLLSSVPLESISLSPSSKTLQIGEKFQITVNYSPSNATNKEVLFISENESVATVDEESGLVTAVGVGTTRIGCLPDETGVSEAYMEVTVEEGEPYIYSCISSYKDVTAGDTITFVSEAASKVCGTLSGSYLTAVDVTISDHTISSLPSGAETFLVSKNGNSYNFTMNSNGHKLGYATTSLLDNSGTFDWSLNIENNYNATIMGGSYYLSYNASSPRWKTYSSSQGDFQVYKRTTDTPTPTPVTHTLSPISGDSSVEVDSYITLSTSCDQGDTITWTSSPSGKVGFTSSKLSSYTGNSVDVYGISKGSVTITATCAKGSSVNKTITVNAKEVVPTPIVEGDYFTKVTSDQELISGDYLIVYENESKAFDGSLSNLDDTSNTVSVSIEEDKIGYSDILLSSAFTYDSSSNTLRSKSGYYIGREAYDNGLDSSTSEAYTNTVSYDENSGHTSIVAEGGCSLMFNDANGQKRFRYYKSGQQGIDLYKAPEIELPEKILDSISVTYSGGDLYIGEELDYSKITVTAHYTDPYYEDKVISAGDYTVEGFDSSSTGNNLVTISYTENEITKTDTFNVLIKEDTLLSIEASSHKTFHPGEIMDKSFVSLLGHYASGDRAIANFEMDNEGYKFLYSDAPSGGSNGTKLFRISALGKECDVAIPVSREAYVSIETMAVNLTPASFKGEIGNSTSNASTKTIALEGIEYDLKKAYIYNKNQVDYLSFGRDDPGEISNITPYQGYISSITYSDLNSVTPKIDISEDGSNYVSYSSSVASNGHYRYFRLHYTGMSLSSYTNLNYIRISLKHEESLDNIVNYLMYEDNENQCLTKLEEALSRLNKASISDISTFFSSNDYKVSNARTRLEAWAAHQGKQIEVNDGKVTLNGVNPLSAYSFISEGSIPNVLVISISLMGLSPLLLLLKRKREE